MRLSPAGWWVHSLALGGRLGAAKQMVIAADFCSGGPTSALQWLLRLRALLQPELFWGVRSPPHAPSPSRPNLPPFLIGKKMKVLPSFQHLCL